jgi:hypothetical protein
MAAGTAQAAATDVVLYASDSVKTSGNWTRIADSTAAGGQTLSSADKGWSSPDTALAAPADYVEFTFNAPSKTPYRLWVRMRAASNNKFNDSLFAQFSDAVSGTGSTLYPIGTTTALTLNLQWSNGAKLNGWGWVSGAYWLSQTSMVSFSNTGAHTLRLQTREDGVQIDQIVLSPVTYLSSSPGQKSGDSTIIAKSAVTPVPTSAPYSGTAIALPGTFEAENFDLGGEGVAYHDLDTLNAGAAYRQDGVDLEAATEGGYDVGWVSAGEWLAYSVNVQAAGAYLVEARVAAPSAGGTFHIEFGGVNVTGPLTIPATGGWQVWATVSKVVTLNAGRQLAKVVFDTAGASAFGNLNWVRVAPAVTSPYTGTAAALPGTLALDKFDNGGEGLAYHDTTLGNSGGVLRTTDVDLETSSLGTPDIGWVADGEWVSYSVNVAAAGTYTITAKVASPSAVGKMHVNVGNVTTTPQAVPMTGGWQVWQDISWTATLAAGPQTLTLAFDTGGFNLASLSVAQPIAPASSPTPTSDPAPTGPTTTSGSTSGSSSTSGGSTTPSTPTSTGKTISVAQGGDLQAAINAALPGDIILLQAGATFTGNFVLPAKTGTGYITIRTNITDPVPAGTRITPATAVSLAKIKSPNTYTAMATQPYAHHYVLQLLDFAANVGGYGEVISLGDGSNAQNTLDMVPLDIWVDRVYVHGDASGQKRGIGLNSASTTIRDSYIGNIWYVGQDSQAIAGWNGPGPYTITNNYLEAASENFLLGGADPSIQNLIPSDIVFTKNYVTKPLSWKSRSDINVKNLFELKNGQRLTIDGNIFENNWLAAQAGYAIVLTGRSQDGLAPWSVVQDFSFTNNIVRHVASAINILGKDYRYPSGISTRIVFRNNLFEDVSSKNYGGDGRFMLINGGVDITVDHNTIIQDGYSVLYADTNPVQQFTMTNNIAPDYSWAIMGGGTSPGNGTITAFFPNSTFLRGVWAGSNSAIYPTGNYFPASLTAVGFVNLAGGDYHLSSGSLYRNAGLDGTDVGANIDKILAATAGVK